MVLTEEDIKKFDELVSKEEEEFDEVRTLLSTLKVTPKEISVYGMNLKVIPTIPRGLRKEISKFESISEDLEATEQHTYKILAQVCVNPPFNKPEVWEYIDEKTGLVPEIMQKIFNEAYEVEKKIEKFRKVK